MVTKYCLPSKFRIEKLSHSDSTQYDIYLFIYKLSILYNNKSIEFFNQSMETIGY